MDVHQTEVIHIVSSYSYDSFTDTRCYLAMCL